MYKKIVENYTPINKQEEIDQKAMLAFIDKNNDALLRTNLTGHFTSSAIVVNVEMSKVLFIHHNIYNSWGWVGGHNDGDADFLGVALKEAKEETGVKSIIPHNNKVIGLDTIYVLNHFKNGELIPDHIHMNLTFLLIADESEEIIIKYDENSGVKWFHIEDAIIAIDEPRMVPIYTKLFRYINCIKKEAQSLD